MQKCKNAGVRERVAINSRLNEVTRDDNEAGLNEVTDDDNQKASYDG
jgi:hypothetical protein